MTVDRKTPILLFAAGLGTRMGHLTKDRPKPLVEVAGETLLDHALDFLDIPQIGERVVNIHYKGEQIRAHLSGTDIRVSDETERLLDTGGGLRKVLPSLGTGPVITMNTDAVWCGPNPILQVLDAWEDHMDALLLLVPRKNVHGHPGKGDFDLHPSGQIVRGVDYIYSGVQIVRPQALDGISEMVFSMNVVWDRLLQNGGLFGAVYPGQWCDVGQPSSIPIAERMLHV